MDDGGVATNDPAVSRDLMLNLERTFKFKDCGTLTYFLGMSVKRNRQARTIFLSQPTFTGNILKRFWYDGPCRPTSTPMSPGLKLENLKEDEVEINVPFRNLVGALMYLATNTRPDICYAVNTGPGSCINLDNSTGKQPEKY